VSFRPRSKFRTGSHVDIMNVSKLKYYKGERWSLAPWLHKYSSAVSQFVRRDSYDSTIKQTEILVPLYRKLCHCECDPCCSTLAKSLSSLWGL
jgi:hypothetical protein